MKYEIIKNKILYYICIYKNIYIIFTILKYYMAYNINNVIYAKYIKILTKYFTLIAL